MLLPADIDAILEERYCKRYAIRSLCSDSGKIILVLLTEVIIGHMIIILINIEKACLERTFIRAFCSRKSDFYYCSDNVL